MLSTSAKSHFLIISANLDNLDFNPDYPTNLDFNPDYPTNLSDPN